MNDQVIVTALAFLVIFGILYIVFFDKKPINININIGDKDDDCIDDSLFRTIYDIYYDTRFDSNPNNIIKHEMMSVLKDEPDEVIEIAKLYYEHFGTMFWIQLLHEVTGDDIIKPENAGKVDAMQIDLKNYLG